ncbi:MAG: AAA family ATPase [Campylobacterota bacterium]|nr:AAA family ATPase [Campylobacterota bacterium]
MAIDKNDIEKYIFDPKNPKQCKSYNLLLNIAKKENLVYISSDFIATSLENEILNDNFREKIWDRPINYDKMSIVEKVQLFKDSLSEKEYLEHIDSLKIKDEELIYNKVFNSFVDIHPYNYLSNKLKKYNSNLLKTKLEFSPDTYSWAGYAKIRNNYNFFQPYHAHKILFTNNINDLMIPGYFFDTSSIVVTSNFDMYIDINKSEVARKNILRDKIHKNVKPIFLNKMSDVLLLLKILQEDLKRELIDSQRLNNENIYNLERIKIENFFSIKNIYLENLQDKKEIYIVGENGDGKTLLLQAIALGLKGIDEGDVFNLVKSEKDHNLSIEDTDNNIYTSKDETYKNFFAYGANRNNNCQMKEDETGYLSLFNPSLDLKNPIDWLKYLDHSEKSEKENVTSVANAKKLLQELLESDVEINIEPDKVTFAEKGSVVSFEQLSAGYKGVITIVADLLVRLSENQPYVKSIEEFRGIVVIDEVELHLHPKWKYSFVEKLRNIFPSIQFMMTTHSPTVLLGASPEAVFYKIYKEDGEVKISNQIKNEGYTNNTLVSSPLFDLGTVTSKNYDSTNKSLSNDDYVYEKIHETISEKIQNESLSEQEDISKMIDKELSKL